LLQQSIKALLRLYKGSIKGWRRVAAIFGHDGAGEKLIAAGAELMARNNVGPYYFLC
jgi:hypothetical protein